MNTTAIRLFAGNVEGLRYVCTNDRKVTVRIAAGHKYVSIIAKKVYVNSVTDPRSVSTIDRKDGVETVADRRSAPMTGARTRSQICWHSRRKSRCGVCTIA